MLSVFVLLWLIKVAFRFKTILVTDSEAQDVDVQPQTRKKYCGKQYEGEVTKKIRNGKVTQNFPNRVKRGRKKKGVFGRVKQETERDSESASQELKKGFGEVSCCFNISLPI